MDWKLNRMDMTAHYAYFQFYNDSDPYFVRFFKRHVEGGWEVKVFNSKEHLISRIGTVCEAPTLEEAWKQLNAALG